MTAVETAVEPRPYGTLATFGWVLLAGIISSAFSGLALYAWYPDRFASGDFNFGYDGQMFARVLIPSTLVQIAVLAWAARLKGWGVAQYLGLILPGARETVIALACLVAWLLGSDAVTWLLGKDIVTSFQTDIYRSARATGAALPLWIALVLVGPAGEEIMFRGFLYRGWASSARAVLPAIVVISALWALLHIQYDWFGISQVFLTGLFFGWVRWRSGSTALTFLLHAIMNTWATLETIVALDWLS